MKLGAEPEDTVADIVRNVPLAVAAGDEDRAALARVARERYDWKEIAATLHAELEAM
jgi:hypothetical protein